MQYTLRMSILNPITNAGVLALDGTLEPEARLQSLLRLWLGNYFTGAPFTTRNTGGTQSMTFLPCDFLWQEDVMPKNPQKPVIHTLMTSATERLDLKAGVFGHSDRWQLDILLKVPPVLTATPVLPGNPEHVVRRLAGQMVWLFSSSEREALATLGVHEMKLEHPPAIVPGTGWHMRMLTASCLTRREQAI